MIFDKYQTVESGDQSKEPQQVKQTNSSKTNILLAAAFGSVLVAGSYAYLSINNASNKVDVKKISVEDPIPAMNLQSYSSLPNSTIYASFGYDIITGNPLESGSSIDPGFSAPIF